MKAMILAAGLGTRLLPLTKDCPKPMLKVAGKPLLEHHVEWLKAAGIREIVINLHHLGEQIEAYFGDGHRFGVTIGYSREAVLLDTGGGIAKALPLLGGDPFIWMNGDIWCPEVRFPSSFPPGSLAHLILCPMSNRRSYGDFDLQGQIVTRTAQRPMIFASVALLDPRLFQGCPDGPFSMARDLLFHRLNSGEVTGEVHDGDWTSIDSLESLSALRGRLQS